MNCILLVNQHLLLIGSSLNHAGYRELLQGGRFLCRSCFSCEKSTSSMNCILLVNQHLLLIGSSLNNAGYRELLQGGGDFALVGAASAAKLLNRKINLVDELHIVGKSTFIVNWFVPKPRRWGNAGYRELLQGGTILDIVDLPFLFNLSKHRSPSLLNYLLAFFCTLNYVVLPCRN